MTVALLLPIVDTHFDIILQSKRTHNMEDRCTCYSQLNKVKDKTTHGTTCTVLVKKTMKKKLTQVHSSTFELLASTGKLHEGL